MFYTYKKKSVLDVLDIIFDVVLGVYERQRIAQRFLISHKCDDLRALNKDNQMISLDAEKVLDEQKEVVSKELQLV